MKLQLALVIAAVSAGCSSSTPDPCGGVSGRCLTVTVEGTAMGLDQLRFTITQPSPASTMTPGTPSAFSLPVKVGLVLPDTVPDSVDVVLDGMSAGTAIAQDLETIVKGEKSVTFRLNTGTTPDLSVPDGNGDMAGNNGDMTKPALVVNVTGNTTGFELDPMNVSVTATDPAGENISIAITGLPRNAIADSDGGVTQNIQWVPAVDQSGMYTVMATVTAPEASRSVTVPINLTVNNVLDPLFPGPGDDLPSPQPIPTNAVGDFDGDGKVDVASASVKTNTYTVTIVYGDVTGLPTAMPLPPARVKQYTFPASSAAGTLDNKRLQVAGGDINGDGMSDILITDPAYDQGRGMVYIMLGTARATASATVMLAYDETAGPSPAPGENVGFGKMLVGDFTGDGKADFLVTNGPAAGSDVIWRFNGAVVPSPFPTIYPASAIKNTVVAGLCGRRQLVSMGDVDNDVPKHAREVLVYDPSIGASVVGDCNTIAGGFTILSNSVAPANYQRPGTTQKSFGSQGAPAHLCDVDGDGFADLVVADGQSPGGNAWIWFSTAGTYPIAAGTLDESMSKKIAAPVGRPYNKVACANKFQPGAGNTLLLGDGGNQTTIPAHLDIISSSRTPMVVKALHAPGSPPDINFGSVTGALGDVNGDGREDLVVGAVPSASGMPGNFWIYYGR